MQLDRIVCGDCLEVMAGMEENSVDSIITDPPYGLEFMGKEWDSLWAKRDCRENMLRLNNERRTANPYLSAAVEKYVAGEAAERWHFDWCKAALRVAKPGALMLAFGGTRTHHRLMCAIEDAGWEIRDTMLWLHSQGFPKSHDVSKAIDKGAGAERKTIREIDKRNNYDGANRTSARGREFADRKRPLLSPITIPITSSAQKWSGHGTGLKPAFEPIILAMKPLDNSDWLMELTPELLDEWEAIERAHE